jgi:hypothetical protein
LSRQIKGSRFSGFVVLLWWVLSHTYQLFGEICVSL